MGAAPAYGAIAFDLDGTLVDSAPDICLALNTVLFDADLRGFDLQTVQGWIGGGLDLLIDRALVAQGRQSAPLALRTRLRQAFDALTLEVPVTHSVVFQGVARLLAELGKTLPLVVVTNRPAPSARAVLDATGLLPYLAAVHGAETIEQRKPAPLLLQAAAAQLQLATGQVLMVGDGAEDLLAARAAGCGMALAEWGYGHGGIDASEPRLWRVRTPAQLLDCAVPEAARRA